MVLKVICDVAKMLWVVAKGLRNTCLNDLSDRPSNHF